MSFKDRLRIRTAALGVAGLLALGAPLALPATTAAAADGIVSCPLGTQSTTYTPGLTFATPPPQVDLEVTGTLGLCVSTDLNHTAGTYDFTGSGNLNCLTGSSAGVGRITWANPGTQPSVFTQSYSVALRPNGTTVLVSTGPIVSGDFAGHTLVITIVLTSTDLLACATPQGMTNTAGPFLVTIL
ncbi:MAG TPA: hypothetical protein VN520_20685 [Streptomyces sp.]|uniref:hypothetical protein n=1 Tax=Streptomyces sp. TaxID=1931 RepID=UPI002CBD87A6|nr:hypothetical protein [Streptomyces sp.]HWU08765.1 hypothetical protein [Streptomyces sp.]